MLDGLKIYEAYENYKSVSQSGDETQYHKYSKR